MKPTPLQLEALSLIARYGGISPAWRASGRSMSSLSENLTALEAAFGAPLCVRSPFKLSRHGRKLARDYDYAYRLLKATIDEIYRETRPTLKFAAAEAVTQHFLPSIAFQIEERHPNVQCSTDSGNEEQLRQMLQNEDVDIVIAPEDPQWTGFTRERLITLPLALLGPRSSAPRSAAALWSRGQIDDVLFISRSSETIMRRFDTALGGLGVTWHNRRFVSSVLSVQRAVAAGLGYGLTVNLRGLIAGPDVRALPLEKFEPVPVAAYLRGPATPVHRSAVELLRRLAREIAG